MKNNWKKNIVLFLASQTISLFGSSLVQYAIMWYITLQTQSGVMMTISIICGFVPTFFLSPFAGVWADRYNRKLLIVMADFLIAAATFILAIIFLIGYREIWLLFAMSAVRALGSAVQTPAVGALIPQIVPEDKLTKVNGANGSIQAIVMLLSPMASGYLLSITTMENIFFIDVVTAAIAIIVLLVFLKIPAHSKAREKQSVSYFEDLKKGYVYIINHGYIKRFFIFIGIFFLLASPASFLTPLQVTRSFGDEVWRLTAIEVGFSVGMILGGVLMFYWGGFKNRIHTMTLSFLVIGTCTFTFGIIRSFWPYVAVMGAYGLSLPLFNTPATVLLQENVEGDYLGRVFGVLSMLSSSLMPLGMLFFGPLADIVKIEWLLIPTGILTFIQAFFLIGSRVLVEVGKPKSEKSS